MTWFESGGEELFGYRAEEVLGQRAATYYRGRGGGAGLHATTQAEGRIRNYETAFRVKDGAGWRSAPLSLLRDVHGAIIETLAIYKDMTEHAAGRGSPAGGEGEVSRTLFEECKDAIVINTPEGKVVDVNQAFLHLFSARDEVMKMNVRGTTLSPLTGPGFGRSSGKGRGERL